MLSVKNSSVMNLENAMRGARNPLNSWARSDSFYDEEGNYVLGSNDLSLAKRLAHAGSDHRKYLRQVFVSIDITAPLYWWKEFDTYKVGTVANSCSSMHKITEKEFTLDDFSHEHMIEATLIGFEKMIEYFNVLREAYLSDDIKDPEKKKEYWWQIIQLLPSSYNQTRNVMLNYEVLANMYKSRKNHKLDEWVKFCEWIESLPFSEIITGKEEE